MAKSQRSRFALLTAYCLLTTGLVGCESFQRKFTRRSKPQPPPTPIISFQDYTQAMTPLDRYRKHYLIFQYWDGELLEAFQSQSPNPKRLKRASSESLGELQALQGLVTDDVAVRLSPLIEERAKIDEELQRGATGFPRASALQRVIEAQSRRIHREFFWRDVEDHLKNARAD